MADKMLKIELKKSLIGRGAWDVSVRMSVPVRSVLRAAYKGSPLRPRCRLFAFEGVGVLGGVRRVVVV